MRRQSFALLFAFLAAWITPASAQIVLENVAYRKPATASNVLDSTEADYSANSAVDGYLDTMWNAGQYVYDPFDPSTFRWLQIDLMGTYSISKINIIGCDSPDYDEHFNEHFALSAGTKPYFPLDDYIDWKLIAQGDLYDHPTLRSFEMDYSDYPVIAQYLKFDVTAGNHWAHLNELEVWGVPVTTPEPVASVLFIVGGAVLGIQRRLRRK